MTRDEELDWLCRLRSEIYVFMPKEWLIPMKDALDMAIKALEQQTCEDAVSREAVLGLFAQNADAVRPYSKTWEEVKALPSVNPQYTEDEIQKMQELEQAEIQKAYELGKTEGQKTGYWIKYGKLYQCSECKELSCCQGKFCNECGAKMVEPQESEVQDADCN